MPIIRKITAEEAQVYRKNHKPVNQLSSPPAKTLLTLPRNSDRILLIHPPIIDIRIPWAQYIQPTRLLRLASFFRNRGSDVRFIDAVASIGSKTLKRVRVRELNVDGHSVNVWRFGITRHAIEKALRSLRREGWVPDLIYVECATTFWWEGTAEVTNTLKLIFPNCKVVLIGAYAELASEHAKQKTGADEVGQIDWSEIANLVPDLSHYDTKPDTIYLSLAGGTRQPEEVVNEISELRRLYNAQSFAFLDHAITTHQPDVFRNILEEVVAQNIRVRFSALGDLPMKDLIADPDLAQLMKRAGYVQICFADDRDAVQNIYADQSLIDDAVRAAEVCRNAGFQLRTEAITASLCIGRAGESLEQRAKTATYLAHHLGSIIFWPYQPSPTQLPNVDLENQNGKLFPMRELNGVLFKDYLGILGLASILNAKYRTATFDFLGDGLISQLFRESIDRQAWAPPEEVKGTLKLPARK